MSARRLPTLDGWFTATVLPHLKGALKKDAAHQVRLGLRHMHRISDPVESRSFPVSLQSRMRSLRF